MLRPKKMTNGALNGAGPLPQSGAAGGRDTSHPTMTRYTLPVLGGAVPVSHQEVLKALAFLPDAGIICTTDLLGQASPEAQAIVDQLSKDPGVANAIQACAANAVVTGAISLIDTAQSRRQEDTIWFLRELCAFPALCQVYFFAANEQDSPAQQAAIDALIASALAMLHPADTKARSALDGLAEAVAAVKVAELALMKAQVVTTLDGNSGAWETFAFRYFGKNVPCIWFGAVSARPRVAARLGKDDQGNDHLYYPIPACWLPGAFPDSADELKGADRVFAAGTIPGLADYEPFASYDYQGKDGITACEIDGPLMGLSLTPEEAGIMVNQAARLGALQTSFKNPISAADTSPEGVRIFSLLHSPITFGDFWGAVYERETGATFDKEYMMTLAGGYQDSYRLGVLGPLVKSWQTALDQVAAIVTVVCAGIPPPRVEWSVPTGGRILRPHLDAIGWLTRMCYAFAGGQDLAQQSPADQSYAAAAYNLQRYVKLYNNRVGGEATVGKIVGELYDWMLDAQNTMHGTALRNWIVDADATNLPWLVAGQATDLAVLSGSLHSVLPKAQAWENFALAALDTPTKRLWASTRASVKSDLLLAECATMFAGDSQEYVDEMEETLSQLGLVLYGCEAPVLAAGLSPDDAYAQLKAWMEAAASDPKPGSVAWQIIEYKNQIDQLTKDWKANTDSNAPAKIAAIQEKLDALTVTYQTLLARRGVRRGKMVDTTTEAGGTAPLLNIATDGLNSAAKGKLLNAGTVTIDAGASGSDSALGGALQDAIEKLHEKLVYSMGYVAAVGDALILLGGSTGEPPPKIVLQLIKRTEHKAKVVAEITEEAPQAGGGWMVGLLAVLGAIAASRGK